MNQITRQAGKMDIKRYNAFCKSLPHSTHVVQWGGAHVWKVGGKVFAVGGWQDGKVLGVTFKCSPMSFELLKQQKGCRPAPYLASRGMLWIQRISDEELDDAGLKIYLRESYRLVFQGLSKKRQGELQTSC
jgi:predicted DNA-binding protein (MmcQ/YjbR family)